MYDPPQGPRDTRGRILARARERFNAEGIDNVGVRELARDLGMSPGNVTYHFAGKEDLVAGLLDELRARNDARPTTAGHVTTVPDLLRRFEEALVTQLEYRCLTESIVHVVKTWPRLHERYHSVETARRRGLANAVRALVHAGELAGPTEDADVAVLVATWSLIGRFWLAESGISYRDASPEQAVGHYVALVAASLQPWVRDPQVLRPWRTGVLTDAALGR